MEQAAHTPGPWRLCSNGECSCMTVSCGDHPIAKVTSGKWGDDYASVRLVGESSLSLKAEAYTEQITYGEIPKVIAVANARLIAAAPTMLAALKQARDILRGDGAPGWGVAKDIINQAIADAEPHAVRS